MNDDSLAMRAGFGLLFGAILGYALVKAMDWSEWWILLAMPAGVLAVAALFYFDPLKMNRPG